MSAEDEQKIRALLAEWERASIEGDLPRLLSLMSDDVVFLVPGQPPMDKRGFARGFEGMMGRFSLAVQSTIQEIAVEGALAYCWARLAVSVTPLTGGTTMRRSGFALSVFRKLQDGNWVLARDANLLTVEA